MGKANCCRNAVNANDPPARKKQMLMQMLLPGTEACVKCSEVRQDHPQHRSQRIVEPLVNGMRVDH